jgi:hypothetical protein
MVLIPLELGSPLNQLNKYLHPYGKRKKGGKKISK